MHTLLSRKRPEASSPLAVAPADRLRAPGLHRALVLTALTSLMLCSCGHDVVVEAPDDAVESDDQAIAAFMALLPSATKGWQGGEAVVDVKLNGNDASRLWALSVTGLPSGVSAAFSNETLHGGQTARLTLRISPTAPVGQTRFTVRARRSGSTPHQASGRLTIVAPPEHPGSYPVTSYQHTLRVQSGVLGFGARDVALSVFVPTGVRGAPVVVFHPGFQLGGASYTRYAQHLASRGIATVIADPPDSPLFGPSHAELAGFLRKVIDWVETEAVDGGLTGVDPTKLGLAGHSLGGKISLLTAATDPRPRSVFAIDPVDATGSPIQSINENYPSVTPELMGRVTVPIALIGETTNATCSGFACQACAPAADNFHQYASHAMGAAVEIEVVGANHMSFLDDPKCGFACSVCAAGSDTPSETHRRTRRYLAAFFELTLRGERSAREWLDGPPMAADITAGAVKASSLNGF